MAKIVNDSLLVSKPNAPLDPRCEVRTLADVENIENPSDSLIFKVLENGKYYKVDLLKEIHVDGTDLRRKVIDKYSPVDGFEDAPNDGYKYVRQNGLWVRYQSNLDNELPILCITLKSTTENDSVIEGVKFLAKYGDREFELSSGEQINVPYGVKLSVEFPEVEYYIKPDDIQIDGVSGNIFREVVYESIIAEVDVYVSAEDGSSVDGQIVTAEISSEREYITRGVYIEDTEHNIFDENAWDGTRTPNSIVVIDDDIEVKIALISVALDGNYNFGTSVEGTNVPDDAIFDMDGEEHTNATSQRIKYWSQAKEFAFPNGDVGAYIPALGELDIIRKWWPKISACFYIVGETLNSSVVKSSTGSTNYTYELGGYTTWELNMSTGEYKVNPFYGSLLFFRKIDVNEKLRLYKKEEHEVFGGKVSFDAVEGDNVRVSINAKNGDYTKPDDVSFIAEKGKKSISLVYIPLLIDTIYINNLIADTDSIVSGEVNGKAVQAIWANTKRYLGKIIAKDDGANELVLHDIDQNDNRYYPDGVAIDLEGLGTSAYFFTKIPSMSYRITQMSENVFKVQICYKYKPVGDGWKYFKELILPTFCHAIGSGYFPVYKETMLTSQIGTNSMIDGMRGLDIVDYSNFMLLLYAKYGALNIGEGAKDLTLDPLFKGTNNIKTGFSLAGGTQDTIYNLEGINPIYNMLGLELLFRPSYRNMTFASGNKKDGMTNNLSVSGEKLTVVCRDISLKLSIGTGYVRSLYLGEYFLFIPSSTGGSSETYYRLNCSSLSNPKLSLAGSNFTTVTGTEGSCDRVVIDCDYRIEEDFVKFNELENVWKE